MSEGPNWPKLYGEWLYTTVNWEKLELSKHIAQQVAIVGQPSFFSLFFCGFFFGGGGGGGMAPLAPLVPTLMT